MEEKEEKEEGESGGKKVGEGEGGEKAFLFSNRFERSKLVEKLLEVEMVEKREILVRAKWSRVKAIKGVEVGKIDGQRNS